MNLRIAPGDFLIADSSILGDTSFHRSVILICAINEKSPMGFIVNKAFDFTLSEVLPEINKDIPLFYGGPVDTDQLFFVYDGQKSILEKSKSIDHRLYFGGTIEAAIEAVDSGQLNSNNCRFFLGYSGWEKGQLQEEIVLNSWIIQTSTSSISFLNTPAQELWRNALIDKGGHYRVWANTPQNPSYN